MFDVLELRSYARAKHEVDTKKDADITPSVWIARVWESAARLLKRRRERLHG